MAVPPATWLQGSHSSSTASGMSGVRRTVWACMAMVAHNMPWVMGTALGTPVEPEVKRYLATVSGVIASTDACTAAPTGVAIRSDQGVDARPSTGSLTCTTCTSGVSTARSAFW